MVHVGAPSYDQAPSIIPYYPFFMPSKQAPEVASPPGLEASPRDPVAAVWSPFTHPSVASELIACPCLTDQKKFSAICGPLEIDK